MEFEQKVKVSKWILFSFLEFSSDVSLGGIRNCSDMFLNLLFDSGSKFSISQESFFLIDDLVEVSSS